MNHPILPYRIFPLGDSAITIDLGNRIDPILNREVIARYDQLLQMPLPGMIEVVPAYSSITVYYDVMMLKKKIPPHQTVFEWMKQQLAERLEQPARQDQINERILSIPVCYEEEFAMDIQHLASTKNISVDEVIQIHSARQYKVYMLGFLPGFPYMGEVDEKIAMPRKPQPVNIEAGSVGIAGKQTGIYPLNSPGGWQIIGRTPLKIFEAPPRTSFPSFSMLARPQGEALDSESLNMSLAEPTLLKAGDLVQFYSITKNDFYEIQNSPSPQSGEGVGG